MKAFLVYTGLRTLMFAAVLVVVVGLWVAVFGSESTILWPVMIAFVLSGLLSYFVLNRPREALARRVQARAERATGKFEELRAKED